MTIYIVEPPEGKVYQASCLQEHMRQEASNLIKECKKHEPMPHQEGSCWCTNDICPHIFPHRILKARKENNEVTLCNTWKEVEKTMKDDGMYQCSKCDEWMDEDYLGYCGNDDKGEYWDNVCDDCGFELEGAKIGDK